MFPSIRGFSVGVGVSVGVTVIVGVKVAVGVFVGLSVGVGVWVWVASLNASKSSITCVLLWQPDAVMRSTNTRINVTIRSRFDNLSSLALDDPLCIGNMFPHMKRNR